ncbi:MAG: S8 family peptidase [Gemmatimonadaceae bacterium]|nr:S8 family peptidase [Gemmatimonadaceae bacterium]
MSGRRWYAVALLPLLAACADERPSPAAPAPDAASFRLARGENAEPIPGRYIVVLRDDAPDVAAAASSRRAPEALRAVALRLASRRNAKVGHVYGTALRGFAAEMSEADARALAADPGVAYVEQDQVVRKSATQSPVPSWGLDRIDERARVTGSNFTYTRTGSGVSAYIVDTGINFGHVDFGGRAVRGFDAFADGRNGADCDGHGTHVAGTVGGSAYGVAKAARLVAVRVLDCNGSGSMSGVIAGVDWVRLNAPRPAVANLSLGGPASSALDQAVANAVAAGITMVVAAGNDGRDACGYSPARARTAITVGATTTTDARATYSNFGSCLDIFAPGSGITSAWFTSTTATSTISGTSMAAPHVAGVAALYLQANPSASPATVTSALLANATTNLVTGAGRGSPNRLLFTNY